MTIKDLIDKLREEKHNGRYVILEINYESYEEYVQKRNIAEPGSIEREMARANMDERFNILDGFLWGLCAADYITNEERGNIKNELMEARRKK